MKEENPTYRIMDLEESERPRERLALLGPKRLSNPELLAILLRTGLPGENAVQIGHRLLHDLQGLSGIHRAPYEEVCNQKGIGPAKAAQLKAAIELGRRMVEEAPEERPVIQNPADAAALVRYDMSGLEQEELRVLLLDTRHRVTKVKTIYKGSLNTSQVRVSELFKDAIRANAAALIVVHNHPSGDPSPSPDDIAITRAIVQAGSLLDIEVLDHLIIGDRRFISLKERGLGFG